MAKRILRLASHDRSAPTIEYGLIAARVAVVGIVTLEATGASTGGRASAGSTELAARSPSEPISRRRAAAWHDAAAGQQPACAIK